MKAERSRPELAEKLSFGPFDLSVSSRLLLREGKPVQIGSRAFDILVSLISHAGEVVSKRELMDRVWPSLTVDEGSLRVHIAGLRKVLGDGEKGARYITNVPGRGYSFVAAVVGEREPPSASIAVVHSASLPPVLARMVGREDTVQFLASQLLERRVVSLVGPGGVGKTTVAVRACHQLHGDSSFNIYFVNLSVIADPRLVHVTVATVLGVSTGFGDPISEIVAFLKLKRCLLVLDSCEHVIEAVAALAEAIFHQAPLAHLLTTTREALRVEGEHVFRLAALECPPEGRALTLAESLTYPAVELFVERARASVAGFKVDDEDAPVIAEICRRLDGLALAIELGAGRVEAHGLAGTAQLLANRLGLLWHGRRTAPPRHQTLNAMLDWSYELLEAPERTVFARLAVFASHFTLKAAHAIVGDDRNDGFDISEVIASLVAKSLVSPITGRTPQRYRLLDTTRAYASAKLDKSGHYQDVARRHAEFFASVLKSVTEHEGYAAGTFMESLNDVRSALEWCFTAGGEASIGVSLAAASATPFLEHALVGECHRWTQQAIACLTESERGTALELELQTSLGWSAMFATGKGDTMHGAFWRGLEIADSDPDPHQKLRLFGGLNFILTRKCDYTGALKVAEQAAAIARQTSDRSVMALADWALGVSHHFCSHHALVVSYCESALKPPIRSPYVRKIADYGYDYRGRALLARARSLWLLGYPDQAAEAARFALEVADELDHPISVCLNLLWSSTVFIWCNDWAAADAAISRLVSHFGDRTLVYRNVGLALQGVVTVRRGDPGGGLKALRQGLIGLMKDRFFLLVPLCRTTLAEALIAVGHSGEAESVIDVAVEDLGPQVVSVSVDGPEVLRVKGVATAAVGRASEAEEFLLRAIDLARQQSALSWELRATMSLARMRLLRGEEEAAAIIAPVYARFTEGFETDDLRAARIMIEGHR